MEHSSVLMLGAEGCLDGLLREPQHREKREKREKRDLRVAEVSASMFSDRCDTDTASVHQLREFWENVVVDRSNEPRAGELC